MKFLTAGRKAIVLFTDGIDIDSRTSPAQTLRAAEETEVLIYSVRYDTSAAAVEKNNRANASLPFRVLTTGSSSPAEDSEQARSYLNRLADKNRRAHV